MRRKSRGKAANNSRPGDSAILRDIWVSPSHLRIVGKKFVFFLEQIEQPVSCYRIILAMKYQISTKSCSASGVIRMRDISLSRRFIYLRSA